MHIISLIGGEHPERSCKRGAADVLQRRGGGAESDEEVRTGSVLLSNLLGGNEQSHFLRGILRDAEQPGSNCLFNWAKLCGSVT